ncbi:MAG: ankyrin repeat domain-containing protein [Gammaproteobacteria bacterium]|jgi:ankyrin repeat protein
MTRALPARPSLAHLKKQAKQLLKKYQDGNGKAREQVHLYFPSPDQFKTLRDAQLVIARSYGYPGWSALSHAVDEVILNTLAPDALADQFVDLACVQYTGQDADVRYHRAAHLLSKNPWLAEHNFISAIVANNLYAVSNMLKVQPTLATTASGPRQWPPLMYLAYSRIPESGPQKSATAIARLLLEHAADPNTYVLLQDRYRFTVLTGVIGEGERGIVNQPPHQYARELARLLLEYGANPNESQGLYNTAFTDSGDFWLRLLVDHGLNASALANWQSDDNPVLMFDFLLVMAISRNFAKRVEYLLELGADPNVRSPYSGDSVHTLAIISGYDDIATQLLAAGAKPEKLLPEASFQVAVNSGTNEEIRTLVSRHPDLLQQPKSAQNATPQTVSLLISMGLDVNHQDETGKTLLHYMAANGNLESVRFLVEHGARDDLRDKQYDGNPLAWAHFNQQYEVRDYLLSRSSNANVLSACGALDRLTQILKENPDLVKQASVAGNTPMHLVCNWLGAAANSALRASIMDVLLAYGGDINATNNDGLTPLGLNQQENIEENVSLLLERGAH